MVPRGAEGFWSHPGRLALRHVVQASAATPALRDTIHTPCSPPGPGGFGTSRGSHKPQGTFSRPRCPDSPNPDQAHLPSVCVKSGSCGLWRLACSTCLFPRTLQVVRCYYFTPSHCLAPGGGFVGLSLAGLSLQHPDGIPLGGGRGQEG